MVLMALTCSNTRTKNDDHRYDSITSHHITSGSPTDGAIRSGNCTADDWRDVRVGLFRESGEKALHPSGLRRAHQLLHSARSCSIFVEGPHGGGSESCLDSRAPSRLDRNLPWRSAGVGSPHATRCTCRFWTPRKSLGFR